MKIIRLSTYLDFGGLERRLMNLSHVSDQNEWVFVALEKEGAAADYIKKNGKRVEILNLRPQFFSFKTLLSLYKFLKKEKPDVVHTSGSEANLYGIIAAKMAGIPVVIGEEIGIPHHSFRSKAIFKRILSIPQKVVGNSAAVTQYLEQELHLNPSKIEQIANPFVFPENAQLATPCNDFFQICSVSRLEPVKNILGFIEALSVLKSRGFENFMYSIIGSGVQESEIRTAISDFQLKKHVQMLGYTDTPAPYYQQCNLYTLNSFTEGFSNSLMEAMYYGLPCIATRVGAAEEMIQDHVNGFLVPPNDLESLVEKLTKIFQMSTIDLEKVGHLAHHKIVENYSLENHIQKLYSIYFPDNTSKK